MTDKEFYCPLYEGNVSKYDCDEMRYGANNNHLVNDGLPHLMPLKDIQKKRMICIRCQVERIKNYSSDPEIVKKVEALEELYKDDDEAIEIVERSKSNLIYIEIKSKQDSYEGQTQQQYLSELEMHLKTWHG